MITNVEPLLGKRITVASEESKWNGRNGKVVFELGDRVVVELDTQKKNQDSSCVTLKREWCKEI